MDRNAGIILTVGVLAIAAYLVVQATTNAAPSDCAGDWTDLFRPSCYFASTTASIENETNTVLIILAFVVVVVVGLIAFGPESHKAIAASGAFL